MTILEADRRRRFERLLRGERKPGDFDQLFLAVRQCSFGRQTVREVGDFIAHRDERDKGPVTERAKAILTSLDLWLRASVLGAPPTVESVRRAGEANLVIATDEQLRNRLSLSRSAARTRFGKALRALENDRLPKAGDRLVFDCLGASLFWNPAFNSDDLMRELAEVLLRHRLLYSGEEEGLAQAAPFIVLNVVAAMHGSVLRLGGSAQAKLIAGCRNSSRNVEIRATLQIHDLGKPILAPVCMFWTTLRATEHCAQVLLDDLEAWSGPLEVDEQCRLSPVR